MKTDDIDFSGVRADVETSMREWLDHHRAIGKPYKTVRAVQGLLKKFDGDADRFIAAVDFSMSNNYQGLFEPKNDAGQLDGIREFMEAEDGRPTGGRLV